MVRPEHATFAAQRDAELNAADELLRATVADALAGLYAGDDEWWDDLVALGEDLYLSTFSQVVPDGPEVETVRRYGDRLGVALSATSDRLGEVTDAQVDTVTRWISTYTVNVATADAVATTGGAFQVAWVTMGDDDVRPSHAALDGEVQPVGGTFEVDGYALHFPGEPVGPPETFINCRCILLPLEVPMTAAADVDVEIDEPTDGYDTLPNDLSWHGVLAPIGTMSGDRRRIAADAISFREFPLPLRWQKVDAPGHDGSVVIGNITNAWIEDGLVKAEGRFASNDEAAEVISLIAEGMLRGLSIDLDGDTTFDLVNDDGTPFDVEAYQLGDPDPVREVNSGRITSAAVVSIPAFQEGFLRLGGWTEAAAPEETITAAGGCITCAAEEMDAFFETLTPFAISESAWDGSASRFEDSEWQRSTILDRGSSFSTPKERYALPIREPNGDLSRAGVHAAAGRLDQVDASEDAKASARRKLVAAYRQLDEDPPESLAAAAAILTFAENPFEDGEGGKGMAKVGDTVTWPGDEGGGMLTGTVVAVDGDTATVDVEGEQLQVPLDVLEVTGGAKSKQGPPADGDRPFAVTSNPGTHDGPGWITHPEDTQRLRNYWTRGKGAAKIAWGTPNDWYRCREQLRKYIPNPRHLAGTCANLHKVATGTWPGQHAAKGLVAAAAPAWSLVAGAARPAPPAAWFTDPGLDAATALQVEVDPVTGMGRVFGHLAAWGTCHIGLGLSVGDGDECVTPPNSASGYAYFRTDAVRTDAGELVPVGHITLGTGHAPASMRSRPAAAHYDNTGSVVADVAVGEDEFGIWVAGVLRPDVDPADLQAASLSGDWRWIAGGYELVAALGVNVPGFPIPRTQVAASADRPVGLVAAGIVTPAGNIEVDPADFARNVYNEFSAIGRRADQRRKLSAQVRGVRRAQLAARLTGG